MPAASIGHVVAKRQPGGPVHIDRGSPQAARPIAPGVAEKTPAPQGTGV